MKYVRRQISVFGNFEEVNLQNNKIATLYNKFIEKQLMPSVVKEFDIYKQRLLNRIQFVAQDNSIFVSIGTNRIDVLCENDMLELEKFFYLSEEYVSVLFELFEFKAKRLSFIVDAKLRDVEDDGKKLASKYLNTKTVLTNDNLIGWEANSVCLFDWKISAKRMESINLNVTIGLKRMQSIPLKLIGSDNKLIPAKIIQGLMMHQDLNTSGENNRERFDLQDSIAFIKLIGEKHKEICKHVEA